MSDERARIEELERQLRAKEKTIAVLMKRAEGAMANPHSAFALLEQNIILEKIVSERTAESEGQRRALEAALAELQRAQDRLIEEVRQQRKLEIELRQAQKLEAVGRLAAGIAHEINTPVQFVSDSIHFVRDTIQDLITLVDAQSALLDRLLALNPNEEIIEARVAAEDDADLEYARDHLPKAIQRALDGLGRVATIVKSMKDFAHPDQREMTPVDLNRAIESTVTIARNEYKYVADLELDLGTLPPVRCHGGDVNQALLNMVVNAAHAIGDVVKGTNERGKITIRTCLEPPGTALIAISDTGCGIPPQVRQHIFEPFFTTKEVGRGTGQGLAICQSVIVERHRGSLTFDTEVGRGTTFFVRLPVDGDA